MEYNKDICDDILILESKEAYLDNAKHYMNLRVWQKAHALTVEIYKITKTFPPDEKYGITNQIRRAVASIPTNIAEGHGRNSYGDFNRFISISIGSANEVEYLLLLSRDLGYINKQSYELLTKEILIIIKMLQALKKATQAKCKQE
ncbi:four helix bundle protein [Petroclostridium sp. X23]|uniref:four helix bundle protein n=1 Tax=Petroclostridium sp. X23 TaxID=3045146 RepID=UPI0024ACCF9B|nr:four helix bundle protein [Petroclostridium sp. X23]WHH57389.1 four helix bundle protein [Petroclostridium sp. X23]